MLLNPVYNIDASLGGSMFDASAYRSLFDTDTSNLALNSGVTMTGSGASAISSTQSKFGGSSLGINAGNENTGLLTAGGDMNPIHFGSDDFTVEFWAWRAFDWTTYYRCMVGDLAAREGAFAIMCRDAPNGYKVNVIVRNGGADTSLIVSSSSLPLQTWTHISVSREGTTLRLFMNGSLEGTASIAADYTFGTGAYDQYPVLIGANYYGTTDRWRGYIDDLRIVPGVALRVGGFSPPSSAQAGGAVSVSYPAPATSLPLDAVPHLSPVAGWGTIKRNPAYSGPALRVANASTADEQDVAFNSRGYVTGPLPYGDDTRVIRLYDQWGSDDLTCAKAEGVRVTREDWRHAAWTLRPTGGTSGMTSTKTVAGGGAWAANAPVWMTSFLRSRDDLLRTVFHVDPSPTLYMAIGLWMEGADLHWRVNGSPAADWPGTNIYANRNVSGGKMERAIGDMSAANGTAKSWLNGVNKSTIAYSHPISYRGTSPLKIFESSGLGDPFVGLFAELHVFNASSAITSTEITQIDLAMQQVRRDQTGRTISA